VHLFKDRARSLVSYSEAFLWRLFADFFFDLVKILVKIKPLFAEAFAGSGTVDLGFLKTRIEPLSLVDSAQKERFSKRDDKNRSIGEYRVMFENPRL